MVPHITRINTMGPGTSFIGLLLGVVSIGLASPPRLSDSVARVLWNSACYCGVKGAGRIVGGVDAAINEWPWQAALLYGGSQFCGGSLINNFYVLTAAHCLTDLVGLESQIKVRLREHNLAITTETASQTIGVQKIIIHASYNTNTQVNDIALLKLTSQVTITPTLLPVCLPPATPTYAGKYAYVTGWGLTSDGGNPSSTLKEVQVPVLSNTACQQTGYSASEIFATMLCAGQTGKDSCQGDSGGPLVFKDGGGYYDQIGIVSWGYGCAAANYPGVYTRVNKYLTWIKSNTADGVYCIGMQL